MSKGILVETSARHLHLSQSDLEALFGPDAQLHNKKDLSQPGQFACEERVDIVGPRNTIKGVSVLGPVRAATQVELSLTDGRTLGLALPVRESGDIVGSPGCTLIGPKGSVELSEGVIAAKRHIHATPAETAELGAQDKEIVQVRIGTEGRTLIFGDVVVRISPSYALAMHIDTDESNAAGISGEVFGEIVR